MPKCRKIIVTFHNIKDCDRKDEKDCYTLSNAEFLHILDYLRCYPDVELTFDDGFLSHATIVARALLSCGLKAKFFVCWGLLGSPGYMSVHHVKNLFSSGMEIGVHGWGHRVWKGLNDKELNRELFQSKSELQSLLNSTVEEIAIPYGQYNRRVLKNIRKCGYKRVYTSDGGCARPESWIQPRNTIMIGQDLEKLLQVLKEKGFGLRSVARKLKMVFKMAF